MPKKADDAGGLSPIKEENEFWRDLGRKELKILIKNLYRTELPQDQFLRQSGPCAASSGTWLFFYAFF